MATTKFSKADLKERLTKEQYRVTQKAGTERPFTNKYNDNKADGVYHCVVCDEALFSSETKYDSGTGWPSFWAPIEPERVSNKRDFKMLIPRVENTCANCDAHLGHVFSDGTTPTNARYCMNSASLNFVPTPEE